MVISFEKIKKLFCIILSLLGLYSCYNPDEPFKNSYEIPEQVINVQYERVLKDDWKAKWIWSSAEENTKNVWLCFNKSVSVNEVPDELVAKIAAENKYWLYINGEIVVREGGLKRGPTPTGCYFDEVDIVPYMNEGENLISVLVWYWGKDVSYSSADAGQGGLLFEAKNDSISILSDSSWSVMRNPAFKEDTGNIQPNYRLPESNVYYDSRDEISDWNSLLYDFSFWEKATEYAFGGEGCWGETYKRDIPLFKDFGLTDYENSSKYENKTYLFKKKITLTVPYNAQLTPYLEVETKAGKEIVVTTENTSIGAIHSTYITKDGVQSFESPAWFNGENITYEIPAGVKIISLKYRESGYNTEFSGNFTCDNSDMNILWQKSLRTLYVTMRDNFMDCPDRERAQWWGDATNEMMMSMYSLDPSSYLLYRKGVNTMLSHINPETKVLQTVVPIKNDYFELPVQQLAGICGFWTYYMYTGDSEFISEVYSASIDYINLWHIGEDGLVEHRGGSWDWLDWGDKIDVVPLENAWYYYTLSNVRNMYNKNLKSPVNIPATKIRPFEGHPYKVLDNEEMNNLIGSIQEQGILSPILLRPIENTEEYEVISGHRRLHAAVKAGMKEVPAFIYAINRDEAAVMLVDSNLHREHILPSEKAFAYKLKLEALNHQGQTSRQVGEKWSVTQISESANESERQIHRYIRLTNLIPELLDLVDEGKIALTPAVELSYLNEVEQADLVEEIRVCDATPNLSQAQRLRAISREEGLTPEHTGEILAEEKANQREKIKIPAERIRRFFPKSYTTEQIEEAIVKICESRYRARQGRDAR